MLFKIHKSYPKGFTKYAVPKILKRGIELLDEDKRFYSMDNYLNETLGIKSTSKEILVEALNTSYIIESNDYYNLIIGDKNIYLDTDYTVEGLVHLIERGNLEVKGTDALQKALRYFRAGANHFLSMYLRGSL